MWGILNMEDQGLDIEGWKELKKKVIGLSIFMIFFYIIMMLVLEKVGIQSMKEYCIDDCISTTVYGNDEKHYDTNFFNAPRKNDTLKLDIDTSKLDSDVKDPALVFAVYNSIVNVSYNGKKIYLQKLTKLQKKSEIGQILYVVPLPDDYRQHKVVVSIVPKTEMTYSFVRNVYIVPAELSRFTVLSGKEFRFLLFMSVIVISAAMSVYLLIYSIRRKKVNASLFIMMFCFLISCWYEGTQCFFYLLTTSTRLASVIEYYALFLMMIPLSLYMGYQLKFKVNRIISFIFADFFTILFAVATYANVFTEKYIFSDFITILHSGIAAAICFFCLSLFSERKYNKNIDLKVLRIGILISMVIAIIELIRWNLCTYYGYKYPILAHSVSFLGLLVIETSLLVALVVRILTDSQKNMKQTELEKIAYTDSLTGIPNRSACYKWLEKFRTGKEANYSLIFFDANNLKNANDNFGHEVGDKLLMVIADALSYAFGEEGYYGRWGGDEFLAGSLKSPAYVDKHLNDFNKKIVEYNKELLLPFGISVSVGRVDVTKEEFINPFNAVNMADADMYVNKKRYKKTHTWEDSRRYYTDELIKRQSEILTSGSKANNHTNNISAK